MEMENTTQTPAPITALDLLNRQLTDWQNFHAQLEERGAPIEEIDYVEEKINALNDEIFTLTNAPAK